MKNEIPVRFKRADATWMAKAKFGISVHWTTQSMPQRGERLPFSAAVDEFDIARFCGQVETTGADYVIFTSNHAEHYFPGPVAAIDNILPGRTMRRDLIGEIAGELKRRGRRFILYFCLNSDRDSWQKALGYHHPTSFKPYIKNLCDVISGISRHYAGLLAGWWFDCGYHVDTTGPTNLVYAPSLQGREYQFPWERLTAAAKAGGDEILVAYSPGANLNDFYYTEHQDYWHGERGFFNGNPERNTIVPLDNVCLTPPGRFHPGGLQCHQWTCLDNRHWVHVKPDTDAADPLYSEDEVYEFLKICNDKQAALTLNVEIFQEGIISEKAAEFLKRINSRLMQRPLL